MLPIWTIKTTQNEQHQGVSTQTVVSKHNLVNWNHDGIFTLVVRENFEFDIWKLLYIIVSKYFSGISGQSRLQRAEKSCSFLHLFSPSQLKRCRLTPLCNKENVVIDKFYLKNQAKSTLMVFLEVPVYKVSNTEEKIVISRHVGLR